MYRKIAGVAGLIFGRGLGLFHVKHLRIRWKIGSGESLAEMPDGATRLLILWIELRHNRGAKERVSGVCHGKV